MCSGSGGDTKPITPEGVVLLSASRVSPDGKWIFARVGGDTAIYPLDGGTPRPVSGLDVRDQVIRWTPDMKQLYVTRGATYPRTIDLFDLASGRRTVWKELSTRDMTGTISINRVTLTPDASAYAYTANVVVHSDLYVVEGLL